MALVVRATNPYRGIIRRFPDFPQHRSDSDTDYLREPGPPWFPRFSIESSAGEVKYRAEFPLAVTADLDITAMPGSLVISGRHDYEQVVERDGYHYRHQGSKSFRRELPLPANADWRQAAAIRDENQLTVSVPLQPELAPHRIAIKTVPSGPAAVDIDTRNDGHDTGVPVP